MEKTKKLNLRLKLVHTIDLENDIYSGWWGKKVIYVKR